ncbi:HAD family acid phosphatase [Alteromonas sp. H39]|uniref:HAD family acid phosphatase n=1 Tax=Alteromonas sp. H39 TaxID=3389876 RepID=UPI0039E06FCB
MHTLPRTLIAATIALLSAGCATQNALPGDVVSASPAVAPSSVSVSSEISRALKISTWNTEHLAFPADTGCRPRNNEELAAMSDYIKSVDADIFALQEVASKEALAMLFPESDWRLIMSSRPDSESYECRESGFTSTQQKLAFAVRKAINVTQVNNLATLGLDNPGLRFGVAITVDSPLGPTDILTVHLKSGCFVDDYARSDSDACETLASQVPVLDNWVQQREQAGTPYVILGDFNHRLSAPYNRLTQTLQRDNRSTAIATRNLIGCHPRYPAPIDHIITGGMNAAAVTKTATVYHFDKMDEDAMLSDHCAVSVRLFDEASTLSNAVIWQRTSKEYELLTAGMYQQAIEAVEAMSDAPENWVAVMDVDETVLDNSAYQQHTEMNGKGYAPDTWDKWVASERATLVPGAKAFIEAIFEKGGRVALITNRNRSLDMHTWRNLQALGVPVTSNNTCLMGRADADKKAMGQPGIINDKDLRRQQISSGSAQCFQLTREMNLTWKQPHHIAFQVGDNIEDFAGVTQEEADIEMLLPELGDTLFLLPNPMYGSW